MEYTMTHESLHIVSILEFLSEFLSPLWCKISNLKRDEKCL